MSSDVTAITLLSIKAAAALSEAGDDLTADLGLTRARWQVLGALSALGAPSTVSQIARAMGLSRQAVQRTADDLSREGLTEYRRNLADKRADLLVMTERGQAAHVEALRRQRDWSTRLAYGLNPSELRITRRTLAALIQRADVVREA